MREMDGKKREIKCYAKAVSMMKIPGSVRPLPTIKIKTEMETFAVGQRGYDQSTEYSIF